MDQAIPEPERPVREGVDGQRNEFGPTGYGRTLTPDTTSSRHSCRLLTATVSVFVLTLLGVPFGLLWAVLAPGMPVVKTPHGPFPAGAQPEEAIAAEGWFTLLGMGFGVLTALAVWLLLRRWRGLTGLLVSVLGGVGAALVAWRVGRSIGLSDYQRQFAAVQVGDVLVKPADLHGAGFDLLFDLVPVLRGDVLLPALAAAVTYTLLAGWSRWPSLQPEPLSEQPQPGFVPDSLSEQPQPSSQPQPMPRSLSEAEQPQPSEAGFSSDSATPPARPAGPERPARDAATPPPG